jgi:hypothetical protein
VNWGSIGVESFMEWHRNGGRSNIAGDRSQDPLQQD